MHEEQLDARGLICPLPVLKTQSRLRNMSDGSMLTVLVTDPKAPGDFDLWCKETGNEMVSMVSADEVYTIVVKKRG